jgi:hypothetical protein
MSLRILVGVKRVIDYAVKVINYLENYKDLTMKLFVIFEF